MTPAEFDNRIRTHIDKAISDNKFTLLSYTQTFSQIFNRPGQPNLGFMNAVLNGFAGNITADKAALGLQHDFDWHALKSDTTGPNVDAYYVGQPVGTLVGDTVRLLLPLSSAVA